MPYLPSLDIPRLPIDDQIEDPDVDDTLIPPDVRRPQRLLDSLIQRDDEFSDSDDEGEGGRRNVASHRERDSVGAASRRFGAAVGIMSSGSTHGAGPSVATSVAVPATNTTTTPFVSAPSSAPVVPSTSAPSAMEVDEPEVVPTPAPARAQNSAPVTTVASGPEPQDIPMVEVEPKTEPTTVVVPRTSFVPVPRTSSVPATEPVQKPVNGTTTAKRASPSVPTVPAPAPASVGTSQALPPPAPPTSAAQS